MENKPEIFKSWLIHSFKHLFKNYHVLDNVVITGASFLLVLWVSELTKVPYGKIIGGLTLRGEGSMNSQSKAETK